MERPNAPQYYVVITLPVCHIVLRSTTSIRNFFLCSFGWELFHNGKEQLLYASCLSVCPSVCTYQPESYRISVKFDIGNFYYIAPRKFEFV